MVSTLADLKFQILPHDQGRALAPRLGLSLQWLFAVAYLNRMAGGLIEIS